MQPVERRTVRFASGSGTVACVLLVVGGIGWGLLMWAWVSVDPELEFTDAGPLALALLLLAFVVWATGRTRIEIDETVLVVVNPLSRPVLLRPDSSWSADRVDSWIYQLGTSNAGVLRLLSHEGRATKVVATVTVPRDKPEYLSLIDWLRDRGVAIDDELITKGPRGV
jgi:hypothetical protein